VTSGLQADLLHAGPAQVPTILLFRQALEGSAITRGATTAQVLRRVEEENFEFVGS
jgi:hypothetical protein